MNSTISLEKILRQTRETVDSWDIVVSDMPESAQYLKDIYYGIGVALVKKSIEILSESDKPPFYVNTSLKYYEAVDKFIIDYMIKNYRESGFDISKMNEKCQISVNAKDNTKNAWNTINHHLKKFNLTFEKIREMENINEEIIYSKYSNENEAMEIIEKDIEKYVSIAGKNSLVGLGLKNGKRNMSQIFVEIAKKELENDYSILNEMPYQNATNEFKKMYFRRQYIDSGEKWNIVAERSGIDYNECNRQMNILFEKGFRSFEISEKS